MPLVITCTAALNPRFNVSGVELLIESITIDLECFDDGFATKPKERFNGYFQGLYNTYYLKYVNLTTQSTLASSSTQLGGNPMVNLFHRLKDQSNKRAKSDRLGSFEYERYLSSDFLSHLWPDKFAGFDVLGFWKAKESMFPILSQMARDMLSVQATSVAFKSVFSTSEWVLSIRRTRLTQLLWRCKKMHFLLFSISVVYVLTTPIPEDRGNTTMEQIRKRNKWDNDDCGCRVLILNGMSDHLFDIYQNVKSSKELWDSLEAKYMAEDASSKKYTQHKMNMYEAIQVSCIIDKLLPSCKYFKHTLKHQMNELTLVELGSHLRIEESLIVQDNDKPKGNNVVGPSVVNYVPSHS
nr:zinc finger, CCHC-type [Tanacetum cinerariifolium]